MLKGLKKLSVKNRRNLKLASVICMSAFSLIAVVTACFAWFTYNHEASGKQAIVSVGGQVGSESVLTVHRCKTNESTESHLKFDPTDNGLTAINLDYYSELNISQPILLLFKMKAGGVAPDLVKLTIKSQHPEAYSTINTSNSSLPNYYGNFSLCSAVGFKVIAYNINQYDTTGNANPFNFNNVLVSGVEQQSFVEVNNNQLVWSHKTGNQNDESFDLYKGTGTAPLITYLAVIMDYNAAAINFICNNNPSNNYDLTFDCDFHLTIY